MAKLKQSFAAIVAVFVATLTYAESTEAAEPRSTPDAIRKVKDHDKNGKNDTFEVTYELENRVVLRVLEKRDDKSDKLEVRVTLLLLDGAAFWTEMRFADGEVLAFVERKCPFGLGMSKGGIVLFDKDRKMFASLMRDEKGWLTPTADEEIERAMDMVKGLQAITDEGNSKAD